MKFKPSPKQVLALWTLLFRRETPMQSKLKPELKPKERKQLVDAGLIELEERRKGRSKAKYVLLTDKAWAWAAENLDAKFSQRANAGPALEGLLASLKAYMKGNNVSLAQLLSPRPAPPTQDAEEQIRAAYLKLSKGQWNARVRLADLRRELPPLRRQEVDDALLRMQSEQKLVLYHLDDALDRTEADEAAALDIKGFKRHLVYMRG